MIIPNSKIHPRRDIIYLELHGNSVLKCNSQMTFEISDFLYTQVHWPDDTIPATEVRIEIQDNLNLL